MEKPPSMSNTPKNLIEPEKKVEEKERYNPFEKENIGKIFGKRKIHINLILNSRDPLP